MSLMWMCEFLASVEPLELTFSMREKEWRLVLYFIFSGGYSLPNLNYLYDIEIFPTFLVAEALIVMCYYNPFTFLVFSF